MPEALHRPMRRAYSFDEVALVPGAITINPEQVDVSATIGSLSLNIPVLAAAMDSVVDVAMAIALGRLGGLAVLNLEGVQTRYRRPEEVLQDIVDASPVDVGALLQKIYSQPIQETLVQERIQEAKSGGAAVAAACTPANAARFGSLAVEAGVDLFAVQSTVTTARHASQTYSILDFSHLCKTLSVPIVVGNCVSFGAALDLMETGIAGILVGVGPGAACTSRQVLGIGVPQITATLDCAAARDHYFKSSGRYVAMITDGGMSTGGDVCKAFASGADVVMLGSPLAQAREAPGRGYHWGMATPHPALPRGTRIKVGTSGSLEQILLGPTSLTNGTQNLIGALRMGMGMCGAKSIKEMHQSEMVIAPSIRMEGKLHQIAQGLA